MTDQEAFEMGLRWLDAEFKTSRRTKWAVNEDIMQGNAPDPRDPGNKGHAVAQLRERLEDRHLYIAHDPLDGDEFLVKGWVLWHRHQTNEDLVGYSTEEDCITAALEATKP
jgi:hypothetical protein